MGDDQKKVEKIKDENIGGERNLLKSIVDQNREIFHKYWESGITTLMFKRNGLFAAKPETSEENKAYNEDLYEDLNRNDARGMYAKKRLYAELLNQLVDFHNNELQNLDPKLHSQQEIVEYCRNNLPKSNMFFELVSMGGTNNLSRTILAKDADQLKALTDYAQVIGGYIQGFGTLAQSDSPYKDLSKEQLETIYDDPELSPESKGVVYNFIQLKISEQALPKEIDTYKAKFTHGRYTVDDFNENPAAEDPTLVTGGFNAHKEAFLQEIARFEQVNNPYADEYINQLNDLKAFLQGSQDIKSNTATTLQEKSDALSGAIQKITRKHKDLPQDFKAASKNLMKHITYFRNSQKILAGLRQDEQDLLRDAAIEHGFAASDAEVKEWFRQYKFDARMSGQADMLPKSSDMKGIREIFNKKVIERMQNTPEYIALKEESLKKLKGNIAELKKALPDFDLTEEQIEKCLSPEKLCVKLMSIKNPPKEYGNTDLIRDFLPGGNVFQQYGRAFFQVLKNDTTPEAQEYNKAIMYDTQRLDKKGFEARKELSARIFNTIKSIDADILTNKEDMSVESLNYCLYNRDIGNLAWEVPHMLDTNHEVVPKDAEMFKYIRAYGQGVGSYVESTSKLITSDVFLEFPHEYLDMGQMSMLMQNDKNPIYPTVVKMLPFISARDTKLSDIKQFTDKYSLATPITTDDFVAGPDVIKEELDYNKIRSNILSAMTKIPMDKTYPKAEKFNSDIAEIKENVQELYKAFGSNMIPDGEELNKIVEISNAFIGGKWNRGGEKIKGNPELKEFANDFKPLYDALSDCITAKEILNLAEYQKEDLPEMVTYKNIFRAQAEEEAAFIEDCANTLDKIDSAFIPSSPKFKDLKTAFKSLKALDENIAKLGYKNNLVMMKKRKDLMQDLADKCKDYADYKTKEAQERQAKGKTPLSSYAAKRLEFAQRVAKLAGKQAVELDVNIQIAKNLVNPNKTREEKQAYIATAEDIRTQKLDAIDHPVKNAELERNVHGAEKGLLVN